MPLLAASPLIHQKRMAMLQVLHHLQVQVADWHSSHVPGRRSHLWWRPQEESLRNWAAAPETSNCSVYSGCLHHKTPPQKKKQRFFFKNKCLNMQPTKVPQNHLLSLARRSSVTQTEHLICVEHRLLWRRSWRLASFPRWAQHDEPKGLSL